MIKYLTHLRPVLLASSIGVLLCAISGTGHAEIRLDLKDHVPLALFPSTGTNNPSGVFTNSFTDFLGLPGSNANPEFRVVPGEGNTGAGISGGGVKSIFSDADQVAWIFADDINLTSVENTDITIGTDGVTTEFVSPVAPSGGTGLFKNAIFLGGPFGFLAPIVGSAAGDFYGNGTIVVDISGARIQVLFPVLEAHWGQGYFPLGLRDDGFHGSGITFNGNLTNIQLDTPSFGLVTFDFIMTAEHVITGSVAVPFSLAAGEDSLGFINQATQWEVAGTGVAPFVSLNPPTEENGGTVASTLPNTAADNGRITQSELENVNLYNAPADDGATSTDEGASVSCIGSCFAFTVSGFSGGSAVMVLPLSIPIPDNAFYRKFVNGGWGTFDESAGDTIESGLGVQGNCAGVVYAPGLTAGDFCVRLTIADGGPNDSDGVASADGTIIDPGGVAQLTVLPPPPRPSQSIDDASGCSISEKPVLLSEKSDWLIVLGFIGLLGFMRSRKIS